MRQKTRQKIINNALISIYSSVNDIIINEFLLLFIVTKAIQPPLVYYFFTLNGATINVVCAGASIHDTFNYTLFGLSRIYICLGAARQTWREPV